MDLNLYLGPPHSSSPRTPDLGLDLSLCSSISGQTLAPEATSAAMEASASHDPYTPYHAFIVEADSPSVSPRRPDLQNPMLPYFQAFEPYPPSCAQEAEGPSAVDPADRDGQRNSSFDEILGFHLCSDVSIHVEDFHLRCSHAYPPPSADSQGEQLMPETTTLQPTRKPKPPAETVDAESSENGADEKNNPSTDFDCNVCFDTSKEAVVTPCGHLFCWPCLYQWLHVFSQHMECPVCKGRLVEANLTPIYGRGSSGSDMDGKHEESQGFCPWIPPRPRGHRRESCRQRFLRHSRRIGEGISNPSWRSRINQLSSSRERHAGLDDAFMQEIVRIEHDERGEVPVQASPSSTAAMICGGSSVRDGSIEPNSVGSSKTTTASSGAASDDDDEDGGNLRSSKRKRLH